MTSKVEQRLLKIGVTIPDAPSPAANYLPFTRAGNLVFVSGQVPFVDGKLEVRERSVKMQVLKMRKARQNMCNQPISTIESCLWRQPRPSC